MLMIVNQLKSAKASLFRLHDYKKSFETFKYISNIAADDYRGWLGMAISESAEYIMDSSLDIYQCLDCGALYMSDTNPERCEFCVGHLQGYKQNWSFSKDKDIKNRLNEIKKIRKYIENASKVSTDIINVKLNKITGRLDERLTELEPLEQLRSYSSINSDISSNKGRLSENKRRASEIDEKESEYMLKYFFICFVVTIILFLLSLTGVVFFIVSAIIAAVVLILGMIILGTSKKEKINFC